MRDHADRIAVQHGPQLLTYAELDQRVQALAYGLSHRGVGPGGLVAIHLPRSPALIVAILAAWRVGAGFVSLDPSLPRARLRDIADDSRPTIVVTDNGSKPEMFGVSTMSAVHEPGTTSPLPPAPVVAESVAYIVYTSGTTGRPKGIVISHSALAHLVSSQAALLPHTPVPRTAGFFSPSFDGFIWELSVSVLVGRTLVLIPEDTRMDPHRLQSFLREERIAVAALLPQIWERLAADALPELQAAITAGTACPAGLSASWDGRMFNSYGPTETTVCATSMRLTNGDNAIGHPLSGTSTYVLDAHLRQCAVGEPGELYVAGPQLSHGYLGRPGRTAASFVPNPFSRTGTRMYATGDRVRDRGDGQLEFLGRSDGQVKIRGHRIELDEIDAVVRSAMGVDDSATVVAEAPTGPTLVSYVEPTQAILGSVVVDWDRLVAEGYEPLSSERDLDRSPSAGASHSLIRRAAAGGRILSLGSLKAESLKTSATTFESEGSAALPWKHWDSVRSRGIAANSYDVIAVAGFHHLRSPQDAERCLDRLSAGLKEGGVLCIYGVWDYRQSVSIARAMDAAQHPETAPRERSFSAPYLLWDRPDLLLRPEFFHSHSRALGLSVICLPRSSAEPGEAQQFDVVIGRFPSQEPPTEAMWHEGMNLEHAIRDGRRVVRGILHGDRSRAPAGSAGAQRSARGLSVTEALERMRRAGTTAWPAEAKDPARYDLWVGEAPPAEPLPPFRSGVALSSEPRLGLVKAAILSAVREVTDERLPGYMQPTSVELVQRLPRTSSGKIARRELPKTMAARRSPERALNKVERGVAEVWADLLGVEVLAPTDDFFALGGHSLLASRMVDRVGKALDRAVSLRSVFECSTLEQFAERVAHAPCYSAPSLTTDHGQRRVRVEIPAQPPREMTIDSTRYEALVRKITEMGGTVTLLEEDS